MSLILLRQKSKASVVFGPVLLHLSQRKRQNCDLPLTFIESIHYKKEWLKGKERKKERNNSTSISEWVNNSLFPSHIGSRKHSVGLWIRWLANLGRNCFNFGSQFTNWETFVCTAMKWRGGGRGGGEKVGEESEFTFYLRSLWLIQGLRIRNVLNQTAELRSLHIQEMQSLLLTHMCAIIAWSPLSSAVYALFR